MKKKFKYDKLIIATSNKNKTKEIADIFSPYNIEIFSIDTLGEIKKPKETMTTFAGNAKLKACYYSKYTKYPVIADDSGLCVEALGNDPGIYSARWANNNKDYLSAISKIHNKLKDLNTDNYRAFFICVIALSLPNGNIIFEEGRVYGKLTFPAKGDNGFGYDSIFIPEGNSHTFAEMSSKSKMEISHRNIALKKMIDNHF